MKVEQLFLPTRQQELAQAIPQRVSCRSFAAPPSLSQWSELSYAAQRYSLPGVRLVLMKVPANLFTGTMLGMGKVSGCEVAAAVVSQSDLRSSIHAGLAGECLCLTATRLGLESCWIGNHLRPQAISGILQPGEVLHGVIALGTAAETAPRRKRKPLEKLCHGDYTLWPQEVQDAASAIALAPSTLNQQPWTMTLERDRFLLTVPLQNPLDLGIALCHAELLLHTPHTWSFAKGKTLTAWADLP